MKKQSNATHTNDTDGRQKQLQNMELYTRAEDNNSVFEYDLNCLRQKSGEDEQRIQYQK